MSENKIYKWSILYEIIRWFVCIGHRLFYSSVDVVGKENIPGGVPVIFAPNHQNALMDPLALVCTLDDQIVFLARADIFTNRITRFILHFLKILPVYRIRDGKDNLDNNKYIFELSVDALKHNKKICLMAEGTHNDKHQLRPLVKGMFRIAFQALESNPSTVIIPVGIDYSDYSTYRSQLIVQFGKAIRISDYKEIYSANPSIAINKLRDKLTEEIKKLMLNIECGEFYNTVNNFRNILRPIALQKITKTKSKALNRFYADKWTTEMCNKKYKEDPAFFAKINTIKEKIQSDLKDSKLTTDSLIFDLPGHLIMLLNALICLIFFPLFLYGFIFNSAIIYLPEIINRKIKDKQFHSSIKFSVTFLAIPLYYLFVLLIIHWLINSWFISFILIFLAFCSGLFCIYYLSSMKKVINYYRLVKHKKEIEKILKDLNGVNF